VLVAGGIYLPRNSKTEAQQGEAQQTPSPASPSNAGIPNTMQQETAPAATVPNPQTPDSTQPAQPATTPEVGNSNAMQSSPVPRRSPAPHTWKLSPNGVATEQVPTSPPPSAPAQNAEAGGNPGETANNSINRDEVEHQIDQLSSRAAAVNSSLDRLQQQQSMAGYGLRGDMAAKQASMKTNLFKAESAAERGDLATAKKRADMAESDVEALEHFLGH